MAWNDLVGEDPAGKVPNVTQGSVPHNNFLTSYRPNSAPWDLDYRNKAGGKGKKGGGKKGSNLMDTGPDDTPNAFEQSQAAQDIQALNQGISSQGGTPAWAGMLGNTGAGVTNVQGTTATGRNTVYSGQQDNVGFRNLEVPEEAGAPPGFTPPPQQARPSNLMDTGPDDGGSVIGGGGPTPPRGGWEVFNTGPGSTGSGYQVHSSDRWAPGNYNIAGDNWHGNRTGYEGSSRVQMGYGLTQVPKLGLTGIAANAIGEGMIGHDELDDGTRITAGSFTPGAFSEQGGQDVSGGATGGDLGVDAKGNKVSLGYGYGQVDPALAGAAGFKPQTGPGTTVPAITGGSNAEVAPAPGSPEARAQVTKDNNQGNYNGTPAENKQEADREAEQQSGPGASAVTDSSGKPVRSSSGSIVTSGGGGGGGNDDSGGGGGGGK